MAQAVYDAQLFDDWGLSALGLDLLPSCADDEAESFCLPDAPPMLLQPESHCASRSVLFPTCFPGEEDLEQQHPESTDWAELTGSLELEHPFSVSSSSSCSSLETLESMSSYSTDGSGPFAPAGAEVAFLGQSSEKKRGRKRRVISDEDRLTMNRTRNREHARITRQRRKQQVESMKQEVAELLLKHRLCTSVPEARLSKHEQVRFDCATKFLALLWAGSQDLNEWSSIATSEIVLSVPFNALGQCTSSFSTDTCKSPPVSRGLEAVLNSVIFLRSFGDRVLGGEPGRAPSRKVAKRSGLKGLDSKLCFATRIDPASATFGNDVMMCSWRLQTVTQPRPSDFEVEGMLECVFDETSKIKSAVLVFDTNIVNESSGVREPYLKHSSRVQQHPTSTSASEFEELTLSHRVSSTAIPQQLMLSSCPAQITFLASMHPPLWV
jgi:hypothetical protein